VCCGTWVAAWDCSPLRTLRLAVLWLRWAAIPSALFPLLPITSDSTILLLATPLRSACATSVCAARHRPFHRVARSAAWCAQVLFVARCMRRRSLPRANVARCCWTACGRRYAHAVRATTCLRTACLMLHYRPRFTLITTFPAVLPRGRSLSGMRAAFCAGCLGLPIRHPAGIAGFALHCPTCLRSSTATRTLFAHATPAALTLAFSSYGFWSFYCTRGWRTNHTDVSPAAVLRVVLLLWFWLVYLKRLDVVGSGLRWTCRRVWRADLTNVFVLPHTAYSFLPCEKATTYYLPVACAGQDGTSCLPRHYHYTCRLKSVDARLGSLRACMRRTRAYLHRRRCSTLPPFLLTSSTIT